MTSCLTRPIISRTNNNMRNNDGSFRRDVCQMRRRQVIHWRRCLAPWESDDIVAGAALLALTQVRLMMTRRLISLRGPSLPNVLLVSTALASPVSWSEIRPGPDAVALTFFRSLYTFRFTFPRMCDAIYVKSSMCSERHLFV